MSELVWGEEPRSAMIAIVEDAPAFDRDRRGGPPGSKILWPFLRNEAGVERHEAWSTTLVKRELTAEEAKNGVDGDEIASWGAVLESQLEVAQPSLILALGKHAAGYLLARRVRMEVVHGLAFQRGGSVVVPAFHPAAGLKDSKRLAFSVDDFKALGRVLRGQQKVWTRADESARVTCS